MNKSAALITARKKCGSERGSLPIRSVFFFFFVGILLNMIWIWIPHPAEGSGASSGHLVTWLTDVATLWHACAAF